MSHEESFQHVVIGKGLLGSAACRYLSEKSPAVAIIGPDEPADWKAHDGVFASHYDSGRITRILDTNLVWAKIAKQSIARYRQLEQESGLNFFHPVGCLKAVYANEWGRNYIEANRKTGEMLSVQYELLDESGLRSRFPALQFPKNYIGILETETAGWINPRTLVEAQLKLAGKNGCKIIRETVSECHRANDGRFHLVTDRGRSLSSDSILIAAGAYSKFLRMTRKLAVTVRAETTVLGRANEKARQILAGMPSLIMFLENNAKARYVYVVPPVQYPDGNYYVKMGGQAEADHLFYTPEELTAWFHDDSGNEATTAYVQLMQELCATSNFSDFRYKPCIITDTKTELPYIGQLAPGLFVATGGCGAAAKSSDEIGRLGAGVMLTGEIDSAYEKGSFEIVCEDSPESAAHSKRSLYF